MRMLKYAALPALIAGLLIGLAVVRAADDAPQYSIKEVMKMAHHGQNSLAKKVASGKATKDENKKLIDLYTALAADKPPQGDIGLWKEKTGALVDAAKGVNGGKAGATQDLAKAMNCGACHKVFRPKKA